MNTQSVILIVDDSRTIRRIMRKLLADAGYPNVEEAADGHDAMEAMERRDFDIVLSDWNMGPFDGLSLLKEMRLDPLHHMIPFVMATSRTLDDFERNAGGYDLTYFLPKPFRAESLLKVIRRAATDLAKYAPMSVPAAADFVPLFT